MAEVSILIFRLLSYVTIDLTIQFSQNEVIPPRKIQRRFLIISFTFRR